MKRCLIFLINLKENEIYGKIRCTIDKFVEKEMNKEKQMDIRTYLLQNLMDYITENQRNSQKYMILGK